MARDLAISNGRLLPAPRSPGSHAEYVRTVQEYIERHTRANLCAACGQTMHPAARQTDRQTVMTPA